MTTKVTFDSCSKFQQALRARVERYFRMTGRSAKDSWRMYLKTATIIAATALIYWLLVFVVTSWWMGVLLSIAMGFAIAAIGFNIQHDGGHGAYSRYRWVNRLTALTVDLLGASSYIWARKHNVLHHTYTNVAGHDDDIDLGPLARFSPEQPRYPYHRLQHLYMWPLYSVLIPKWQFWDDWMSLARRRIGGHKLPPPRGWDLVQFVGGKLAWFSIMFLVPVLFNSFWGVIGCYLVAMATSGIILSVVFQLAHVVESRHFPVPDPETGRIERPWAVHEVETTADFAQHNRLLSWYVGGLNFQIEHHLFPRICHVHYPKIARIVRKMCARYDIHYLAFPTMRAAVASHYRWLREMGRPVPAAA